MFLAPPIGENKNSSGLFSFSVTPTPTQNKLIAKEIFFLRIVWILTLFGYRNGDEHFWKGQPFVFYLSNGKIII